MTAASSCDQPMRGIYGAVTICARPAGHTGKHDPIWNHKDWPEASSAAKTGWACGLYLCPHQPKCEFREPTDEQPAALMPEERNESSVDQQMPDGRWLPAEPMPEPFGVLWGRLWHERRRHGEPKWVSLFTSWRDAHAIERTARGS